MQLPPTTPEVSTNLTKLKDVFESEQSEALEGVFRSMFRNISNVQQLVATVVNANAITTVLTANLPLAADVPNNTLYVEDTGAGHNLIYYTGGVRYRLSMGVPF